MKKLIFCLLAVLIASFALFSGAFWFIHALVESRFIDPVKTVIEVCMNASVVLTALVLIFFGNAGRPMSWKYLNYGVVYEIVHQLHNKARNKAGVSYTTQFYLSFLGGRGKWYKFPGFVDAKAASQLLICSRKRPHRENPNLLTLFVEDLEINHANVQSPELASVS